MNHKQSVTVAEVGEAEVIAAIRAVAPSPLNGDDAAVLPLGGNSRIVCSTDALVEGRHFRFDYSSPQEVGRKAVAQNFADIQAMGARPTALLCAIATPGDMPLEVLIGIAEGLAAAADPWAAELIGGDVVRSQQLVLSLTAIGELNGPAAATTLDAAGAGQRVIAQGPLGWSAAGLAILEAAGGRAGVPEEPLLQELVQWHCAPALPVGRGIIARAAGVAALTDISDGLMRDVGLIAQRSGVCVDLDANALNPDKHLLAAADFVRGQGGVADPWQWILGGGEDHALVGTSDARVPFGYRRIGAVRQARTDGALVLLDGQPAPEVQGWESL